MKLDADSGTAVAAEVDVQPQIEAQLLAAMQDDDRTAGRDAPKAAKTADAAAAATAPPTKSPKKKKKNKEKPAPQVSW